MAAPRPGARLSLSPTAAISRSLSARLQPFPGTWPARHALPGRPSRRRMARRGAETRAERRRAFLQRRPPASTERRSRARSGATASPLRFPVGTRSVQATAPRGSSYRAHAPAPRRWAPWREAGLPFPAARRHAFPVGPGAAFPGCDGSPCAAALGPRPASLRARPAWSGRGRLPCKARFSGAAGESEGAPAPMSSLQRRIPAGATSAPDNPGASAETLSVAQRRGSRALRLPPLLATGRRSGARSAGPGRARWDEAGPACLA